MAHTMREAHVHKDTTVTIHDAPIPTITHPSQILIKVIVSGCNPKDWKMQAGILTTISDCPNSGDDIAGIVEAVGSAVTEFRPGDRVAALHELGAPAGSYAEYALAWDWTTIHIGKDLSFEDAATVPMGSLMASIALFGMLRITNGPWAKPSTKTPLLIYGASSTVGAYAVKLAQLANIHPLICVAGKGTPFVETLIDRTQGDQVVDYRSSRGEEDAVVTAVQDSLQGLPLSYAFDAISEKGSSIICARVLDPSTGKLTLTLPQKLPNIPSGIEQTTTMAGALWEGFKGERAPGGKVGIEGSGRDFGLAMSRLVGRWLQEGRLKAHPWVEVEGALGGVEGALKGLREGKGGGAEGKYVVRIEG